MNRKWILAGAAALLIGGAAMNLNVAKSNGGISDILLTNIQALAQSDVGNGYSKVTVYEIYNGVALVCEGEGSLKCSYQN